MQLLNEAAILETWAPVIQAKVGDVDAYKQGWLAKYCHYHSLSEGFSFPQASTANVPGMGNIAFPAAPQGPASFYGGSVGSGDKFPTLLPLAMQVAARTVGFDIVPVIPMSGPTGVLPYIDIIYASGRLDTKEKPLVVKIDLTTVGVITTPLIVGQTYFLTSGATTGVDGDVRITTKYVGLSRIDAHSIFEIIKNSDEINVGGTWTVAPADSVYLSQVLTGSATFYLNNSGTIGAAVTTAGGVVNAADVVKALEDHVIGFTGAGANDTNNWSSQYSGTQQVQPMLRGIGETAGYRAMGTKVYTKAVDAETFQVSTVVTTEQIQDLNKQFGIDIVSIAQNGLINDISQSINKHILTRAFALGWSNTNDFFAVEGVNLNVSLDTTFTTGTRTTPAYLNKVFAPVSMAIPKYVNFGTTTVVATENLHTLQRRIYSRVMAGANMISTRGRRGPANFIVTNGGLATSLQDSAQFTAVPMTNTINQSNGNLYPVGSIAGMQVYVDPNMGWADNRILIGRKGADEEPGLKFMVYLMAESIQTIAEGTMSPKIAVKSRYALVEAGHHPQTMYCTIHVDLGANGGLF
jgi:hypothetical protein